MHTKTQGSSLLSWYVCVFDVLWQLQSLDLFSALAGRRGALYNTVTPRRHLSSRVFSEHANLFSDNSRPPIERGDSVHFLSIKTDELKEKPPSSHDCNHRCSQII